MKKTWMLLFSIMCTFNANALKPDLSGVYPVPSQPAEVTEGYPKLDSLYEDYKADKFNDFKGRNLNKVDSVPLARLEVSGNITKSVTSYHKTNVIAQIENLESTSGELVQKLEDDRVKVSQKHQDKFSDNKTSLVYVYDTLAKDVDVSKLGKEQDPSVQNAFKCADVNNCNPKGYDKHEMQVCNDDERIHWTGSRWKCIALFDQPNMPVCRDDQFSVYVNNGVACVDYIYQWSFENWDSCESSNSQKAKYGCYQKRNVSSQGLKVDDSDCEFLGDKPESTQSCNYTPPTTATFSISSK